MLLQNLQRAYICQISIKINEKLEHTVNKDQIGQPNGVAGLDSTGNVPIDQLANISTDLFVVVSELPTEDIKEGKIYCIRDTSSTAQDNNYIEYAYINNKWEKVGEFQAEPDLSYYARLDGTAFTGRVLFHDGAQINYITPYLGNFLRISEGYAPSELSTYLSNGKLATLGTLEDFTFTLEDGSTVTKSIRVISTTTSKAKA